MERAEIQARLSLMQALRDSSFAERLVNLERMEKGFSIEGDFEGSVTGYWVRLDETGAGIVKFNHKEYKTETIGFVSLPRGTMVELSYADGKYFSKY